MDRILAVAASPRAVHTMGRRCFGGAPRAARSWTRTA
jgi:hypothetical protein